MINKRCIPSIQFLHSFILIIVSGKNKIKKMFKKNWENKKKQILKNKKGIVLAIKLTSEWKLMMKFFMAIAYLQNLIERLIKRALQGLLSSLSN